MRRGAANRFSPWLEGLSAACAVSVNLDQDTLIRGKRKKIAEVFSSVLLPYIWLAQTFSPWHDVRAELLPVRGRRTGGGRACCWWSMPQLVQNEKCEAGRHAALKGELVTAGLRALLCRVGGAGFHPEAMLCSSCAQG